MKKRGFTIIEVVLVLAIAGLIFLMVFIALPALQRSQRNTRRRQDISRISTAFTQFLAQNGKLPLGGKPFDASDPTWFTSDFVSHYIDENIEFDRADTYNRFRYLFKCKDGSSCEQFTDPDGAIYALENAGTNRDTIDNRAGSSSATDNFSGHTILFNSRSKCSDTSNKTLEESGGANAFALTFFLEGGAVMCVDNS